MPEEKKYRDFRIRVRAHQTDTMTLPDHSAVREPA